VKENFYERKKKKKPTAITETSLAPILKGKGKSWVNEKICINGYFGALVLYQKNEGKTHEA